MNICWEESDKQRREDGLGRERKRGPDIQTYRQTDKLTAIDRQKNTEND